MSIKNIIFDLGGVIIDLDYNRTLEAFQKLGALNFDAIYTQDHFDDFDIGKISPATFRDMFKKKLEIIVKDEEFDHAWNAMLLDIPRERLDLIKNLRKSYRVFLFSNTNEIHLKEVFNICQKQNGFNTFNDYFEKEYYSNILGKRKPNAEAFIFILNENKIKAEETLFIDDSLPNVLGARKVGLYAIHLSAEKSIFDIASFIEGINNLSLLNEKNIQS